ncbi:hypothetical protein BRAS3843_1930007 [Bradyrhizobium sp. STM 3843]|nr:hypothetical protein BRAS3843_1930007 [Bradyrhizobium sp. STM 3843]
MLDEITKAGRAAIAEHGDIDRLRGRHPGHEQRQQQRAQSEHRAERRRAQHLEGIPGRGLDAPFAPAAQFIESERGERAEQCEAGGQREQQRNHRVAERRPGQHQAEHGIDRAQHQRVTGHGLEVFPAELQRPLQIGKIDVPDGQLGRDLIAGPSVWCDIAMIGGHGRSLPSIQRVAAAGLAAFAGFRQARDLARRDEPEDGHSRTEVRSILENAIVRAHGWVTVGYIAVHTTIRHFAVIPPWVRFNVSLPCPASTGRWL